jgi:hypothetical protein
MQIGDRLLHHAGRFHHLRQEHLARAEQVADHVHAGHQRAFDDVQRPLGLLRRASSVSASMNSVMPLTSACSRRFATGLLAPGEILRPFASPRCPL